MFLATPSTNILLQTSSSSSVENLFKMVFFKFGNKWHSPGARSGEDGGRHIFKFTYEYKACPIYDHCTVMQKHGNLHEFSLAFLFNCHVKMIQQVVP